MSAAVSVIDFRSSIIDVVFDIVEFVVVLDDEFLGEAVVVVSTSYSSSSLLLIRMDVDDDDGDCCCDADCGDEEGGIVDGDKVCVCFCAIRVFAEWEDGLFRFFFS